MVSVGNIKITETLLTAIMLWMSLTLLKLWHCDFHVLRYGARLSWMTLSIFSVMVGWIAEMLHAVLCLHCCLTERMYSCAWLMGFQWLTIRALFVILLFWSGMCDHLKKSKGTRVVAYTCKYSSGQLIPIFQTATSGWIRDPTRISPGVGYHPCSFTFYFLLTLKLQIFFLILVLIISTTNSYIKPTLPIKDICHFHFIYTATLNDLPSTVPLLKPFLLILFEEKI